MGCGVRGLWLLPCLLAALLFSVARYLRRLGWRPVVLEPGGLVEHWAAYGKARLTQNQSETFRRDGVVVLRGGPADRALLGKLEPLLRQHKQFLSAEYMIPWLYNGAVRSILRAGHVTDALLHLIQRPGYVEEAPIFGTDADPQGGMSRIGWHMDKPLSEPMDHLMVTAWLAITDTPHGIEFLRGSWRPGVNEGLFRACNQSAKLGEPGERLLQPDCTRRYAKKTIDPQLGYSSYAWWDLRAGDVILFHGNTLHRGTAWTRKRLALSVRARPLPAGLLGGRVCHETIFGIYPLGSAQRQEGADPFECTREMLVAKPAKRETISRYGRLPPEKELSRGWRLLRAAAAWVQGVLLSI